MNPVPHINDMPNLMASLGKAGSDRIRNHLSDKNSVGGPRTRWTYNPHQHYLSTLANLSADRDVDDILSGIAALDQGSDKNLSATRLFVLLACNVRIYTDLIKVTMDIEERQARKYMAAAKLAIFHITRSNVGDTWEIEDLIDNPWTQEEIL